MKTQYNNWVPKRMLKWMEIGIGGLSLLSIIFLALKSKSKIYFMLSLIFWPVTLILMGFYFKFRSMQKIFDYANKDSLAWKIIHFTAQNLKLNHPEGKIIDIGCGSGALSIAVAKLYPKAEVIGIDRWGIEYNGDFNKQICEHNALAEGVSNVQFKDGDATRLDFEDNSFDGLVSNYVYHNIPGDRNKLLKESLRIVKKGGIFCIHDLFSTAKYPHLDKLLAELKSQGYEINLIDTTQGFPMDQTTAKKAMLTGSKILWGKKPN